MTANTVVTQSVFHFFNANTGIGHCLTTGNCPSAWVSQNTKKSKGLGIILTTPFKDEHFFLKLLLFRVPIKSAVKF